MVGQQDDLPSQPAAGTMRELLQVSFPLVVSAGSLSLMNVVDRIFIAQLSVDALAATLPAAMLSWTSISLAYGIVGYANAFASQYEGAGRKERVAASIWQGLLIALVSGIGLLPMMIYAPQIFAMMGHTPHVQALEVTYFRWLCPVAIPTLLTAVLSAFFTARKRSAVIMWVNVVTSLLNVVGAYILVFGIGSFKGLDIAGAAIATVAAQSIGAIALAILMFRDGKREGYPFRETCRIEWPLFSRMIRYGFPNGIQMFLDVGAFTLFVAFVGQLGAVEQAATNLAFTLNSLAFIPMIGMGTAIVTLVGHRIGEGRAELAVRTVWKAMFLAGGYMIAFAILYLSLPDLILKPFMNSSEVELFNEMRPTVVVLLKYVALYTFFDAMAIVFGAAVRGAGDTTFSLVFSMLCGWLLMVVPAYLSVRNGWGLHGCWIAVTVTVFVMGFGFLWRFQGGKWKTMQVIEKTPLELPDEV
ncbi:MATE family efflux transporter [Planctomicrobium sp. SH527]|uniref:MATE family efflux transporter n=1 Tax=Planctomicrobium sp. SH527 TaxID=3448123 RepID=UPI003F5BC53A